MTRSAIALVSIVGVLAVCGMPTLVGQVPTTPLKPISAPPETLRSKLLGLVKERIAKMSDDELRQAIEKENRSLVEVKAQKQLDRAMQALVEITRKYPGTRAAKWTKLLVNFAKEQVPRPDPFRVRKESRRSVPGDRLRSGGKAPVSIIPVPRRDPLRAHYEELRQDRDQLFEKVSELNIEIDKLKSRR